MTAAASLTPREVAELAGTPKRVIEKAIEERVLRVRFRTARSRTHHERRMLPLHAVAYAATITRLGVKLTAAQKRRLASKLAQMRPAEIRKARLQLAPALELNVGRLVGDAMNRAERYRVTRDAWIVIDEEIKGGTPVIRGTRITVYSVLGRVEHGETIDDILGDNPDLTRERIEAAIIYARTHPLIGRPGGRPWVNAA
jgi:uncharacterized protein (DUF433 family)